MSVCMCVSVCVCVFPIEILHEQLIEYFMIESYVIFLEKANDAIFILIKAHFGGILAPYLQTPKTAFNINEPITVKFDIENACTQEIIISYISLDFF